MTCSLLPREILWHHVSKTNRAISLKFCIRNAFIDIITHIKFDFNRLMLTLIFAIWAFKPPFRSGKWLKRPSLIGLISRCFKLKCHTILVQPDSSSYQKSRYSFNCFGSLISWIYTTVFWHDVFFLIWCYIFLLHFSVNPLFVQARVKKKWHCYFFASSYIKQCKHLTSASEKYIILV